jgi:hypothetical protein
MLPNVMSGVPVMVLCLLIQAIFATMGLRRRSGAKIVERRPQAKRRDGGGMKPLLRAEELTCRGASRPTGMWRPFPGD